MLPWRTITGGTHSARNLRASKKPRRLAVENYRRVDSAYVERNRTFLTVKELAWSERCSGEAHQLIARVREHTVTPISVGALTNQRRPYLCHPSERL